MKAGGVRDSGERSKGRDVDPRGWNREQEDWVGTCRRDETGTTTGDAGRKIGRDLEMSVQPVLASRIQSLGRGA